MATSSMDKGLYAAPLGLEEEMGMAPLEIEIEDPEGVRIGMGDIGGRQGLKTSIRIKPKTSPLSTDKKEIEKWIR